MSSWKILSSIIVIQRLSLLSSSNPSDYWISRFYRIRSSHSSPSIGITRSREPPWVPSMVCCLALCPIPQLSSPLAISSCMHQFNRRLLLPSYAPYRAAEGLTELSSMWSPEIDSAGFDILSKLTAEPLGMSPHIPYLVTFYSHSLSFRVGNRRAYSVDLGS